MAEKNSLWKNIRNKAEQNRRTGATPKKPTKEMLDQERKIKAQYAVGGYLGGEDDDPFKSSQNQGSTIGKVAQDFFKGWYEDRETKERLNENFPPHASDLEKKIYGVKEARERASAANLKNINKVIPGLVSDIYDTQFLYNTNPEINTGLLNSYKSRLEDPKSIKALEKNLSTNPQGFTDEQGRIIITNQANTQYGPQSVAVHELTHKVSERDKTLDKLFRGKFQTPAQDRIDANYDKDEMYPFLMQMRFDNKFQPGEEITPERLKQIKDSGYQNHLFKYYNDDEISKYLNTLASNQTQAPMQYAAQGGKLYAEGDSIDPPSGTRYITPTRQDSLMLYNNALDKIRFYSGNPDYRKTSSKTNFKDPKVRKNLIWDAFEVDPVVRSPLVEQIALNAASKQDALNSGVKPSKPMSADEKRKMQKQVGVKKFGKVAGTNLTSFGDVVSGQPDVYYNPLAPPIYLHPNISPQGSEAYISQRLNDLSDIPNYDPLAVAPWDTLNEKQKEERVKKYGTSGTPLASTSTRVTKPSIDRLQSKQYSNSSSNQQPGIVGNVENISPSEINMDNFYEGQYEKYRRSPYEDPMYRVQLPGQQMQIVPESEFKKLNEQYALKDLEQKAYGGYMYKKGGPFNIDNDKIYSTTQQNSSQSSINGRVKNYYNNFLNASTNINSNGNITNQYSRQTTDPNSTPVINYFNDSDLGSQLKISGPGNNVFIKPDPIMNNFLNNRTQYLSGAMSDLNYAKGGPMQYKRGGLLKDIGLGVADFALGTIGGVTGIQSMKDIVNEKQYSNDKFDAGANFAGSIGSTALKLIPVTAPIANAAGIVGGAANKAFGIDAANYNPNQEVSDLEKAGNIVGQAGNVASMFMGNTSGVSEGAGKFMQGVDKINKFGQSPTGQLLNQGLSFQQGGNINNNSVNLQTDSMKNRYKNYRTKYKEGGIIQDKLKANGIVKMPSYIGYHYQHPDGGAPMGPNASVERDELVQLSGGGHAGMGTPEYVYPADVNNAANTNPEEGIYMPQMTSDYKMITDKYGMPRFTKKSPAKWLEEKLNRNSPFRVDVDGPTKESNDQAMAMAKGGREVAVSVNDLKQQAAQEDAMRIAMADNVAAYGGYLSKYRNLNMPKSKAKGGLTDPPDKWSLPIASRSNVQQGSRNILNNNLADTEFGSRIINEYDNGLPNDTSYTWIKNINRGGNPDTESFFYNTGQNQPDGKPFINYQGSNPNPNINDYLPKIQGLSRYAHGGPVVSNVNQDFDLYAQNRGGMMMAQGGMMMPQDDGMSKQIAAALQQGADPQQLLQQLIESGMDPQQAQAMLQAIMDNIQPQAPMMAMGGRTMYAPGGGVSNFQHMKNMLLNKTYRNAYNLSKGYNTIKPKDYPNVFTEGNAQVGGEDYAGLYPMTESEATQYQGYDPTKVNQSANTSGLGKGNENIFGDDKLGKALAIGQAAIPLGEAAYHMFNKPKHIKAPNIEAPIVSYDAARRTDAAETRRNYSTYVDAMRQMNQPGMRSHILEGLGSSQSALAARNTESFEREYNENAKAKAQANALDAQYKFSADQLNYDIDQARIGNIFGALNNAGTLGFQSHGDISNRKLQEKQIASTQSANVTPITINGRVYPATKGPDGYYFNGQRIAEFGT